MWSAHCSASAIVTDVDRKSSCSVTFGVFTHGHWMCRAVYRDAAKHVVPSRFRRTGLQSSRELLGVMRKCGAGSTAGAQSTRLLVSFVCGDVGSERMTGSGLSPDTCRWTLCGSGDLPSFASRTACPRRRAEGQDLACQRAGEAIMFSPCLAFLRAVPLASVGDQRVEGTRIPHEAPTLQHGTSSDVPRICSGLCAGTFSVIGGLMRISFTTR